MSKNTGFLASLSNILKLNQKPTAFMRRLHQQNPDAAVVYFARIRGVPMAMAFDPLIARTILTDHQHFDLAAIITRILGQDFGAEGPFTSGGDSWQHVHSLLAPLFRPDELLHGQKADMVTRETLRMVQKLGVYASQNDPVDILELAQDTTMSIACRVILGFSITDREVAECRHDLEHLIRATFEAMNNPLLLLSPHHVIRRTMMKQRLHRFIRTKMQTEPAHLGYETAHKILFEAHHRGTISAEMYFSCLVQLLVASHETTASAISWLIYDLTGDAQESLYAEAIELIRLPGNGPIPNNKFSGLRTLINRSLMAHSPILSVFRQCTAATMLTDSAGNEVAIAEGTLLYIPLYHLSQAQSETAGIPTNPYHSFVFSAGRRTCPGGRLATTILLRIAALIIAKKLRLSLSAIEPKATEHLTHSPRGLMVHVSH